MDDIVTRRARGRRRRDLRETEGLTKADIKSVSQPVLLRMERGENVHEYTLRLVAEELGVPAGLYFEPPPF